MNIEKSNQQQTTVDPHKRSQEIINHAYSRGGADFYQMLMEMPAEYLDDEAKMSITTVFTKVWVSGAAAVIESIGNVN